MRFAYFGFFCSVNHLSRPLRKYLFACTSSKGHGFWFVIGGSRSVLLVSCFKVPCFVIVLSSGNNRLVKFASQIFMIFLILVTCKNKATCASFLRQKIHSPSRFPSLFLSSLESFSAKLGEHVTLWFALTPPSLKWLTEQKNPKSLLSLQNAQRHTTNFAIILILDMYVRDKYRERRCWSIYIPRTVGPKGCIWINTDVQGIYQNYFMIYTFSFVIKQALFNVQPSWILQQTESRGTAW